MSMDMFEQQEEAQAQEQQFEGAPLATRMRPNNIDGFVGQEHILGKGRVLRKLIESDRVFRVNLCYRSRLSRLS